MMVNMKTKMNDNEVVTRCILRESFQEFAVQLGEIIDKKLFEFQVRFEAKMDLKIDTKVGELAIMIQKGFAAISKDIAMVDQRIPPTSKFALANWKKR
jgi:hypothetical protein